MQKNSHRLAAPVLASLQSLCFARVSASQLDLWWQQTRLLLRREPIMAFSQLLWALVYHVLMPSGSLPTHVEELTGQKITGSALSQRRQRLPWQLFETILAVALRPRAEPNQHPHAFYRGLRLVALDGTSFALSNTPKIVKARGKAASRRFRVAFARVQMVAWVERGLHNPLAAAIGRHGESEYALAERLIGSLPSDSLLLADRLYGLPAFVAGVLRRCREVQAQFLVRVKANLRARCLPRLADGSALVEESERNVAGAGDLWAGAYAGGPLGEGATSNKRPYQCKREFVHLSQKKLADSLRHRPVREIARSYLAAGADVDMPFCSSSITWSVISALCGSK
jgi:hypothetical protein